MTPNDCERAQLGQRTGALQDGRGHRDSRTNRGWAHGEGVGGGRNLAGGDEKEEKPEATTRSPQGRQPLQAAVVTVTILQVDIAG